MLLGFDIGGTKCAVILGEKTSDGTLSVAAREAVPTSLPVYEQIEWLFSTAETLMHDRGVKKSDLTGIGIACGGPLNSRTGIILSPPNLPGWDHVPISDMVTHRFGVKGILQNDADACAVAEWKFGAGRGYRHLVFLTFGTGMGAGLILNGRLYSGASDGAGEAGHIRLTEIGPVGFGKSGSFEGFCSGNGIAQLAQIRAREAMQSGRAVSFCAGPDHLPAITAKTVADAAFAGDEAAIDVYKTCAQYLARGLSVLIDILNPELIIIGGIYVRAQPLIEPYIRDIIGRETLPNACNACQIVPAGLGEEIGDYAALSLADLEP